MKTNKKLIQGLSTNSAPNSVPHLLSSANVYLRNMWQTVSHNLVMANELQVWENGDRWYAYDPMTGKSACELSESEMRTWVEQRYL